MKKTVTTKGVCAPRIDFEIDNQNCLHNVKFWGGCAGNSQGIGALIEGMEVNEAIKRMKGINCRNGTSCPDQLAKALIEEIKAKQIQE